MSLNDSALEVLAKLEEQYFTRPTPTPPAEPRNARFSVEWSFDGTKQATVVINRRAGTFEVRPYRRRKSYTLPLAVVAQLVAERIIRAAAVAKRKARSRR